MDGKQSLKQTNVYKCTFFPVLFPIPQGQEGGGRNEQEALWYLIEAEVKPQKKKKKPTHFPYFK